LRAPDIGVSQFAVERRSLVAEVDADVEARVIPIGVMIAAPLAVSIHAGDIVVHLRAVLAVAGSVVIDSGAVGFQALVAVVGPVAVAKGGSSHGKRKQDRRNSSESQPNHLTFGIHRQFPPEKMK
jgi:hypothetical protein